MTPHDNPLAVFRPVRGRVVASVLAVAAVAVFGLVALFVSDTPVTRWTAVDRLLLASIGWALALMFLRYASIKAVPTRRQLLVRNLFRTHRLEWSQIVAVQYGLGTPWPTVELSDFDTVAVMAIQRADGPRAEAEAGRLAALVRALGEAQEEPLA